VQSVGDVILTVPPVFVGAPSTYGAGEPSPATFTWMPQPITLGGLLVSAGTQVKAWLSAPPAVKVTVAVAMAIGYDSDGGSTFGIGSAFGSGHFSTNAAQLPHRQLPSA
jgi:hypothetical protein